MASTHIKSTTQPFETHAHVTLAASRQLITILTSVSTSEDASVPSERGLSTFHKDYKSGAISRSATAPNSLIVVRLHE